MHSLKPRQLRALLSCGLVRHLVHEASSAYDATCTLAQVTMPTAVIPTLRRACLVRLADDLERMLHDSTRDPREALRHAHASMRSIRGRSA